MGRRPLCLVALLFVLWLAGMYLAGGLSPYIAPAGQPEGRTVRVRGEIYRQRKSEKGSQIYLKDAAVISQKGETEVRCRVLVFTAEETAWAIGNTVEAVGICAYPQEATNPGQFDMAGWYASEGIGMQLLDSKLALVDGHTDVLRQGLERLRERLADGLYAVADEREASLMEAMLLGNKDHLDAELKELYQKSGISHVLAISGLHISLLGMLLFSLARRLGLSFTWAGLLAGALMGAYCVMAGMSVSTKRAFLMFLVYLGAQAKGRTYDLKSSLSLAVVLLLAENPRLFFQAGFQLSVLAVAGLAFLYPVMQKRFPAEGKLGESLLVSLSVQLMIFPCILYHYYEFSAAGLLLNLLVLPGMTALLLFGLAASLLGLCCVPCGIFAFAPCHYILGFMETACGLSLRIPGAEQIWGRPSWPAIAAYYGILLTVFLVWGRCGKRKASAMGGAALLAAALLLSFHPVQGMELTILDVGQGDSIFWQTAEGYRFLCDGGSSSVSEVGKYRITPFLKCKGVHKLDGLFLTHMDEDHVNGAEELLQAGEIRIGLLALPELQRKDERYEKLERMAAERKIPVLHLSAGQLLQAGKLTIRTLGPQKGADGEDKNEASLVLAAQYGEFVALLTGDVEGEGEKQLPLADLGRVSVLKVAHHGSKTSTAERFLQKTRPVTAVISCGEDNSYGHPAKETLDRLRKAGSRIYMTMEQGAVTVRTEGEHFSVEEYWHKLKK